MTLNNKVKQSGFTIVELLIVVVIIAILAAITIVAYNGIQNRARNSSAATAAENMAKKIEAYNSVIGAYPKNNTTNDVTTQLNAAGTTSEYALTGSGLTIGTPTNATGSGTVAVQLCGTTAPGAGVAATGYKIFRWDYSTNAIQTTPDQTGGVTTACTANQTA